MIPSPGRIRGVRVISSTRLPCVARRTSSAFPDWYATLFSGFYLPLLAILVALIVRGVAFEYRHKRPGERWQRNWERALFVSSLLPAFLWGVAFAALVRGGAASQLANGIALVIATLVNTGLNRAWTFGISGRRRLAIHHAQALAIFAIPQALEAGEAIERMKAINPAITVLARAHSDGEVRHLLEHGADGAVLAERELAYSLAEMVMSTPPFRPVRPGSTAMVRPFPEAVLRTMQLSEVMGWMFMNPESYR